MSEVRETVICLGYDPGPAKYGELTRHQAIAAGNWFRARMGVQDWTFEITISDFPPDCFGKESAKTRGRCLAAVHRKFARLWVRSPVTYSSPSYDPLAVLMEEMLHSIFDEVEIENTDPVEAVMDRLAWALADLFRKELEITSAAETR